jgi:hypothetical protein
MMNSTTRTLLGRRIEADGSWTAYHVFTGIPATIGDEVMVGLSRDDATAVVFANNRRRGGTGQEAGAADKPRPCMIPLSS